MRYSLINGFRPVFFTRKAQLFNDLWRDIVDTGTDKFISNPFICKHPANTALPSGPISLNLVPT
ncbi:hypothetical protein ACINNAV18_A0003 (plasmid) [Acinetobacter baumannii Naval-18]|nr:hypothetical protein ACINNAV18_A0003 [Acinetobacter baumannii Naval-18]